MSKWKWKQEYIYGIENGEMVQVETESCYPPDSKNEVMYCQRKFSYGTIKNWSYNRKDILEKLKKEEK